MQKSVLILLGIFLFSFVSFCYAEEGEASVTIISQPSADNVSENSLNMGKDNLSFFDVSTIVLALLIIVFVVYLASRKNKHKKDRKK